MGFYIFPSFFQGGVAAAQIINILQRLVAAGVVDLQSPIMLPLSKWICSMELI